MHLFCFCFSLHFASQCNAPLQAIVKQIAAMNGLRYFFSVSIRHTISCSCVLIANDFVFCVCRFFGVFVELCVFSFLFFDFFLGKSTFEQKWIGRSFKNKTKPRITQQQKVNRLRYFHLNSAKVLCISVCVCTIPFHLLHFIALAVSSSFFSFLCVFFFFHFFAVAFYFCCCYWIVFRANEKKTHIISLMGTFYVCCCCFFLLYNSLCAHTMSTRWMECLCMCVRYRVCKIQQTHHSIKNMNNTSDQTINEKWNKWANIAQVDWPNIVIQIVCYHSTVSIRAIDGNDGNTSNYYLIRQRHCRPHIPP